MNLEGKVAIIHRKTEENLALSLAIALEGVGFQSDIRLVEKDTNPQDIADYIVREMPALVFLAESFDSRANYLEHAKLFSPQSAVSFLDSFEKGESIQVLAEIRPAYQGPVFIIPSFTSYKEQAIKAGATGYVEPNQLENREQLRRLVLQYLAPTAYDIGDEKLTPANNHKAPLQRLVSSIPEERQLRFLVVEDEPSIVNVLRGALGDRYNATIDVVGTTQEGLEELSKTNYDFVLTDLQKDRGESTTGIDVYGRAIGKGIPAAIMTGDSNVAGVQAIVRENLLLKPFEMKGLYKIIDTAMVQQIQS